MTTWIAILSRNKSCDPRPLRVAETMPCHSRLPSWKPPALCHLESRTEPIGNAGGAPRVNLSHLATAIAAQSAITNVNTT
jgi:hypothetical protein